MKWMNNFFQDSNSYFMENLFMLYDMLMMIITFSNLMIYYLMMMFMMNKFNNKKIMENNKLENLWTYLPFMMLNYMIIKSLLIMYTNNEYKNYILNIKIMSYQWFWSYEYFNFNIKFNSYLKLKKNFDFYPLEVNNKLIIPFMLQIQFIITSMDVIHSWSIPSINLKLDSIPYQLNQSTLMILKPSLLYGQCSEICGMNHSYMPIMIESINVTNFIKWLKSHLTL